MAFIDELPEGNIRDVFVYWLGKRDGRSAPLRGDLNPVEFDPSWLPNLFMYRLESNGRFRCILIGTEMVQIYGRDETGMYLDEIVPPKHAASRKRLFERTVQDRLPIFYTGPALIPSGDSRRVERLLLPASSDGVVCDHIFGIANFGAILPDSDGAMFREDGEPARIVIALHENLSQG
jgi:hypothetical protein